MPINPDALAALKRLTDHASPGWRTGRTVYRTLYSGHLLIGMLDRPEDAAFAAEARNAMPALIAEIELCWAELKKRRGG